jgi:hypothetical protein
MCNAPSIFDLKHMVISLSDDLLCSSESQQLVLSPLSLHCKPGLGSNDKVIPYLLDIVDIFHPSNEKAPNFSLEVRSRYMADVLNIYGEITREQNSFDEN